MLAVTACGDDDPAPTVAILEANPDTIDPTNDFRDDLTIRVEYYDADADLGEGVAEVHDCRAEGLVTRLELPAIASDEALAEGVPILGELELVVSDIGDVDLDSTAPAACADLEISAPTAGEAVFCVVLIDAAENVGPGDCTSAVVIEPAT
jgi:hypothetical protein